MHIYPYLVVCMFYRACNDVYEPDRAYDYNKSVEPFQPGSRVHARLPVL